MNIEEFLGFLLKSVQDKNLSKQEISALKTKLRNAKFDNKDIEILRNTIFNEAKKQITGKENICVLEWLEGALNIFNTEKIVSDNLSQVYFSPGEDCRNAILTHLTNAKQTIDVCLFTISDDILANKLIDCHRKGITVRIITDNDKMFDRGSDIERLNYSGIAVKKDEETHHMHHKFAIIDNKFLISGSYNWTRSAALYNQENLIISQDTNIIDAFRQEFNYLWNELLFV